MKAIVSLFVSAYQPGMASIECRANSLIQSRQPLLFSDSDGFGQVLSYKAGGYKESQMENFLLMRMNAVASPAMRIFVG